MSKLTWLFTCYDPARGLAQNVIKVPRVGSGRVESGRVSRFANLAGRVGPLLFFFVKVSLLLSRIWASRGYRWVRFSPIGLCLRLYRAEGSFSIPNARRFFIEFF